MNIGIITYHSANNVGAVLQAFALQTYVAELGHHVEFIDYHAKPEKVLLHRFLKYYCILREALSLSWRRATYKRSFAKTLTTSQKRYDSNEELKHCPPVYDLYITGSDQVWVRQNDQYFDQAFFLDFVPKHGRKISYAASMGQGIVPDQVIPELKQFLDDFQGISIREASALASLKKALGDDADIALVVDPTFLISPRHYLDILDPSIKLDHDFIGAYLLKTISPEQLQIVEYIKRKLDLPIIRMRNPESCIRINPGEDVFVIPEQFLAYVHESSFMICASFHAVVFSLIFEKPFVVIEAVNFVKDGNGNRRIRDLLASLGLEDRCLSDYSPSQLEQIMSSEIDWIKIRNILTKQIESSRQWLGQFL